MRRRLLWVPLYLLVSAPELYAAPVVYEFSGAGGLSGGFILDDDPAAWVIQTSNMGTSGVLSSPIQTLWATYTSYSYSGPATLSAVSMVPDLNSFDHWIVRSFVPSLGPAADGSPQPNLLNLFIYQPVESISIVPPTIWTANQFTFSYGLGFTDGSTVQGVLHTVTQALEPSTLLLGVLGCAGLVLRRRTQA